jgi:tetratricopeptide (TPR) repeat protein
MVVRVAVVALSAVGLGIALVWSRAHEPTLVAPVPAVALSRRPGGRTPVLIAGLANQSGDSRLDETIDAVLGESLYASKLIDRFPPYQIRTLAAELGVDAAAGVEKVSQALLARDGGKVLTLRATLVRTDSGLRLTVAARDVASGQTAFEASRDATSPAEIVLAAAALAREVRRTLGDAALPDAATDTLGLSPSLEALHAWAEGQRLVATGEPFVAVEKLRHAVALDPHFTLAHADLGLALYNTLASAESAVESEVALEQADHLGERRRLKLLADYYGATGRFAESIASYEQLLNLWPGDLSSEISVTATALDAREWPLTVELSRRAARDHPESVVAHQNLVVAELARGSFEDAARDGEAAIARFAHPPRYTFAHLAMAETLEGQRALALVVLDKLAVIDPEFADEARADLAFYEGRLDDAIKLLEGQIREGNARGAPSYFLRTEYITLALIHLRRGDRSWALAALTPLVADIKKDANDRVTYTLAHALVESGGESLAATVTKGWAESSAIEERMYASLLRGDSLRAHGKGHEAILAYREAGRSVDAWLVHARLGESYLSEHLWADAHRELSLCIARRGEGAMDVTPGLHVLPRVYYGLALAKEGLGDANLAAAWEAFLAIEPAAQGDPLATDAAKRLALLKK